MSLIFGGKLLTPKQRQTATELVSGATPKSIHYLSQREQELLEELHETRTNIVRELIRISPEVRKDEVESWQRSLKQSRANLSTLKRNRPISTDAKGYPNRRLDPQTKIYQSLPILSSTGDFTLSFKKKREDPISFPVLTLPPIRPASYEQPTTPQRTNASQEVHSHSRDGTLSLSFNSTEIDFMLSYFSIPLIHWREIISMFEKTLRYIHGESLESLPTVFSSVKVKFQNQISSVGIPSSGSYEFPSTSTLPPIALESNLALPARRPSGYSDSRRELKTLRNQRSRSTNSFVQRSRSTIKGSSNASTLRHELLTSLENMQHYTSEVKQSILSVQDIVALNNPRARSFIVSLAADQLCGIITRIGRRELRRGFDAWLLGVKLDALVIKTVRIRQFLLLRRVAELFNQLVLSVLRFNFLEWVRFSVAEKLRMEMMMKSAAATTIQRIVRGNIGRAKARKAAEGNRFAKLHRSLVKLQAIFRGKLQRWKYLRYRRDILEETSCELIQKVVRGFLGRRRASRIRSYQSKISAAVTIQAAARGWKGRMIASSLRLLRLKNKVIVKIQALARGYIGRMKVSAILREKTQYAAAVKIQARMRGVVTRMNLHHRRREMEEYRSERNRYAMKIQAVYRGFRARIMFRYYMEEHNQEVHSKNLAAIKIQTIIRIFLAHRRVAKLQQERTDQWITDASCWKEIWSEDSGAWFYMNTITEEALWEPPSLGYTKSDGQLVLRNGKVIDPPDPSGKKKRLAGQAHLCVECVKRVAIRKCNECSDNFCTKCYKETHSTGSRKQHTYESIGPIECTECEEELAERWCISCDEPYCDSCWRKVHSKGKRRYHPFSQVQEDGHIDSRIFTIDGEQVHNYDASYSQNRFEEDIQPSTAPYDSLWTEEEFSQTQENEYSAIAYDETSEWASYYDDNSVLYWYNSLTGESTYEDPTAAKMY